MLNIFRTRLVLPALRLARAGPISSLAALHPARVPLIDIANTAAASAFGLRRGFTSTGICLEDAAKPKRKRRTSTTAKAKTATKKKATTTAKKPKAKAATAATGVKAKAGGRRKTKRPVGRPRGKKPRPKPIPKELKPPKQAPNTFAVFYGKFRQGVTHPKATKEDNAVIMKEAASVWRSLSEFEKRPFAEEAAQHHKEYQEKFAAWSQLVSKQRTTLKRLNVRRKKFGRGKLHPVLPKEQRRPLNAFFRYLDDNRGAYSGLRKEQVKAAAVAWKALDASDKAPYVASANEDIQKWRVANGKATATASA